MRELSLFSGAGGGLLGTKLLGWEHVGYVEYNEYCQKVIRQRILDGILDEAPIFGDIRTFISEGYAESYTGLVDVVTAGFPCQPFSSAGKKLGEDDPRNMWPQTIDIIRRVRPRFAFLENVPGLLANKYIRRIFGDLAESGFDARWRVLSAAEMGAPHRRDRLWIVAYPKEISSRIPDFQEKQGYKVCAGKSRGISNKAGRVTHWEKDKPGFYQVDDGVADWMGPVSAYGNGQVPAVVARAWQELTRVN
jgi:DNA (cytosine-5)-methyltransferase 1